MKLAIVGNVRLHGNAEATKIISTVLDTYKPDVVISGGAPGIDTMAQAQAESRGIPVDIKYPLGKGWAYYKPRNIEIAEACDQLVCIISKYSKTYGSQWTRDYARDELGKSTETIVIDDFNPEYDS